MATHYLTEKIQGKYHYTIGPYAEPVLRVNPGDTVVLETLDATGGKVKNEQTKPSQVMEFPFVNPMNGPIFIHGAEKGDALSVCIRSIKPRGTQPVGKTFLIPYFGGLTSTPKNPGLQEPLPEIIHIVEVTEKAIVWNDRIHFPYDPFVGTIGTSPEVDSVSSTIPESHGGNMDLPDVRPGNTLYLPIKVPGALLFLGDCHAAQGDGELCGVAIEFPTETTIELNVVKNWPLQWPRIESKDFIMSIGSTRPMEDAVRIAYMDLIAWMEKDYGIDKYEAYFRLTQVGRVRIGNLVDPNFTVGASIGKQYLVP